MVIFENEHYAISLDLQVPCVVWAAKQKLSSEVFRESEHKLVEAFQKYVERYPKLQIFVDARIVGAVSAEDTTWVVEEILSKLSKYGLKREAFLVPESALEKLIVRNYMNKSGDTIEMKSFIDPKEAKAWLKGSS